MSTKSTPTVLAEILASTRATLEERKRRVPGDEIEVKASAAAAARVNSGSRLRAALSGPAIAVIAEFKRRSPSAGPLLSESSPADQSDVRALAEAYERGGASAMSVLTEEANFMGSLADLEVARVVSGLPLLRKDFTIDRYQLHEALLAGADAILLIVAALDRQVLADLKTEALALGLDALVEVHDEQELELALDIGAELIGINNRDLRDFSVDVGRTARLMQAVPPGTTVISESGIASREQLERLHEEGVAAVLVGETLMRAGHPESTLRELLGSVPGLGSAPGL